MTIDAAEALAVLRTLDRASVHHVTSGGWGVDALLGRQTRVHDDLDVGVDIERLDEIVALLAQRGYSIAVDQRPVRLELKGSDDRKLDLHPIAWDASGSGTQRGFGHQSFDYPAAEIVAGRIDGVVVRCISAATQRLFHSVHEPRDVDRADLAALAALDAPEVASS
jgi:Aminoglycoside-2''''-adenylyltransferase.